MDDETQAQVQSEAPVNTETAPAPTSEADVQVNNETPKAAAAQEATVNAEETVEQKLYAGKYKTPEELEKAYLSASSEATRISQERAELSKILADAFSEPVAPVAPTADYDDYEQEPSTPKPDDVYGRKIAVMEFSMSHPDADGAAMLEVLKSDPAAQRIPDYETKLKYAYAMSRVTAQPKAVEEATKQAQIQAQVKMAEKQAAQVESASRQAPATQEEPLTKEQLRAALKDDKAFGDILKKRQGFSGYLG